MSDDRGGSHPAGAGPAAAGSPMRTVFLGPDGIRAGWSFLIFLALFVAPSAFLTWAYLELFPVPPDAGWSAALLIVQELIALASGLVAVGLMARIEGRSFALYGYPFRRAFGRRFWEGSLWGIASIGGVIAFIALAGGYTVAGLAVHGAEALRYGVLWALALLLVGLAEELIFRSYPLFTLGRGMGFWPAAVGLSVFFGALHYFEKPMETWVDGVSTGLLGLILCFSVRRTGSVWWAIGWHFTYNWGSMFVFGGPNTGNNGQPMPGHLLDSTFHGSQWITGGPMGPEASVFIFVVAAALALGLHRRFPTVEYPPGK
jgi:CAAX protease family protein